MPAAALTSLLAHQGGWDEALLVAGPIIVLAFVLVMANRRATRLQEGRNRPDDTDRAPADTEPADTEPAGEPVEPRDDAGAADTVPGDER